MPGIMFATSIKLVPAAYLKTHASSACLPPGLITLRQMAMHWIHESVRAETGEMLERNVLNRDIFTAGARTCTKQSVARQWWVWQCAAPPRSATRLLALCSLVRQRAYTMQQISPRKQRCDGMRPPLYIAASISALLITQCGHLSAKTKLLTQLLRLGQHVRAVGLGPGLVLKAGNQYCP